MDKIITEFNKIPNDNFKTSEYKQGLGSFIEHYIKPILNENEQLKNINLKQENIINDILKKCDLIHICVGCESNVYYEHDREDEDYFAGLYCELCLESYCHKCGCDNKYFENSLKIKHNSNITHHVVCIKCINILKKGNKIINKQYCFYNHKCNNYKCDKYIHYDEKNDEYICECFLPPSSGY
jgi:hypothetical protein